MLQTPTTGWPMHSCGTIANMTSLLKTRHALETLTHAQLTWAQQTWICARISKFHSFLLSRYDDDIHALVLHATGLDAQGIPLAQALFHKKKPKTKPPKKTFTLPWTRQGWSIISSASLLSKEVKKDWVCWGQKICSVFPWSSYTL